MQALSSLVQVVPPSLVERHFARFDEELTAFVLELLTLPGRPHGLPCAEDRLSVFLQRLRMPTWFNGAGHWNGRREARRLCRLGRVLLEGDRDDGEKPETLTPAFRREFRASLLVASCKGLADMLAAAGMPFAGKHTFRAPAAKGYCVQLLKQPSPPHPY